MNSAETLNKLIDEANRIVFFGGAGVSTESGVPDFRSEHGIYKKHLGAESILTPMFMKRQPEEFWAFYRKFFMMENIKPNGAHYLLAELEKEGKLLAVVTQNVDGLHQEAGSKRVLELHGNGGRFYCDSCYENYTMDEVREMDHEPKCKKVTALRPDIVLYQESLDGRVLEQSIQAIQQSDLLIVGGTSLTVYPAAGLIRYQRNGKLVIVNRIARAVRVVQIWLLPNLLANYLTKSLNFARPKKKGSGRGWIRLTKFT